MARKPRAELEGGLYHVIARGNNRRRIFDSSEDYEKFLSLLGRQKARFPFFLYAFCLMTNHLHLLIERQAHTIGRIMHRLLTGYSQYYNRRYRRVGHLFQDRHKSILCQSDRYLCELVRYIHLNPIRAKMAVQPEDYEYSSHRAYLGLEPRGIVDVDPVLRHFGAKRIMAQKAYREFVIAGMKLGHQETLYQAEDNRILGSDEFVDATIHRIGESEPAIRRVNRITSKDEFNAIALVEAVEQICCVPREIFCGSAKSTAAVRAKELFIMTGTELGASLKILSGVVGLSSSAVSRRHDAARLRACENREISKLADKIIKKCRRE